MLLRPRDDEIRFLRRCCYCVTSSIDIDHLRFNLLGNGTIFLCYVVKTIEFEEFKNQLAFAKVQPPIVYSFSDVVIVVNVVQVHFIDCHPILITNRDSLVF